MGFLCDERGIMRGTQEGGRERAWAAEYPAEWAAWCKVRARIFPGFGEKPDFPDFLRVVGRRPSAGHVLRPAGGGLLSLGEFVWAKRKPLAGKKYLTYKEASAEFGIRRTTLYALRGKGLVETVEVPGAGIRFTRAGLQRLIARHTVRAKEPAPSGPGSVPVKFQKKKLTSRRPQAFGGYGHGL